MAVDHSPVAPPAPSRAQRRCFWGIIMLFVILTLTYGAIIRLGYGPDEPRHYRYLPLVFDQHQLPRVLPNGEELGGAIPLHPPLYYLLVSPLYLLGRALDGPWLAQRLMRLASPIFGAFALWAIWGSCRRIFRDRPWTALFPVGLVALWPHFLMDHSVINNDNGANLAGALAALFLVSRPGGNWTARQAALGGALLGIGAMMKGQLLICLPPVFVIVMAWDHGRTFWRQAQFWRNLGLQVLLVLAIAGWWYGRNFMLYGKLNYVAPGFTLIPPGMSPLEAWSSGWVMLLGWRAVVGIFHSIWSQVGWFPVWSENAAYWALGIALALAFAGWIAAITRIRNRRLIPSPRQIRDLCAIFLPFLFIYLLLIYFAIFIHVGTYQGGRYAMFALGGFAVFLCGGWSSLIPARWRVAGAALVLVLFLTLNILCMYNLLTVLNPTYTNGMTFFSPVPGT